MSFIFNDSGEKTTATDKKRRAVKLSEHKPVSYEWEDVEDEFTPGQGTVAEIFGKSGTGRTYLALTAPGPIAYLGFYEKADGLIERVVKKTKKKIRKMTCGGVYLGDSDEVQSQAIPDLAKFEHHYYDAFTWANTIIVDTHPEAWSLERLAEFGAPKPESGRVDTNWGAINNRWLSLLNMARSQSGKCPHVIFIGDVREEYEDSSKGVGKKTGRLVRASGSASNLIYKKSDIVIETSIKEGVLGVDGFRATIQKGWFNSDKFQGRVYKSQKKTYLDFVAMITETEKSDWLRKG